MLDFNSSFNNYLNERTGEILVEGFKEDIEHKSLEKEHSRLYKAIANISEEAYKLIQEYDSITTELTQIEYNKVYTTGLKDGFSLKHILGLDTLKLVS